VYTFETVIIDIMTNAEIVKIHLHSGLIDRCIRYQMRAAGEIDNREDIRQDLCLLLLRYDTRHLNEVHAAGHMNAFLTRILRQEFHSARSNYHYRYRRHEQSRYALQLNKCSQRINERR